MQSEEKNEELEELLKDAQKFHKALKGSFVNEEEIIEVLTKKENNRLYLQKLKIIYEREFFSDLLKDIQSALSGHFSDLVIALFKTPDEYDSFLLKEALNVGDENTLIDIIALRSTNEIKRIKSKFKETTGDDLEYEILTGKKSFCKEILSKIVKGVRPRKKEEQINLEECKKMAEKINSVINKKENSENNLNDNTIKEIFIKCAKKEIKYIGQYYYQMNEEKENIIEGISKHFTGNNQKVLLAVIYGAIGPSEYYAGRLKDSMRGVDTDDKLLMSIIVSRREIDMDRIKYFYSKMFKDERYRKKRADNIMYEDIKSNTSGYYQKLILRLVS